MDLSNARNLVRIAVLSVGWDGIEHGFVLDSSTIQRPEGCLQGRLFIPSVSGFATWPLIVGRKFRTNDDGSTLPGLVEDLYHVVIQIPPYNSARPQRDSPYLWLKGSP